MNAFAVATVLDIQNDPESAGTWNQVEDAFQQSGLVQSNLLHFSWHVAESYSEGKIEDSLRETAKDLSMILTSSTGLGIFTSEQPVLYLPVSKTRIIADLHHLLWDRLVPIAKNVNRFYDPENWIPHITLAYENAKAEQICKTTSLLLKQGMVFHFQMDHFSLIFRNGSENGIVTRIPFGRLA